MLICLCGFSQSHTPNVCLPHAFKFFPDCPDIHLRFDCKPTYTPQSLQNKNNICVCSERLFIKQTLWETSKLLKRFEPFYFDYCNVRGRSIDFWGARGVGSGVIWYSHETFITLSCTRKFFFLGRVLHDMCSSCNTVFFFSPTERTWI